MSERFPVGYFSVQFLVLAPFIIVLFTTAAAIITEAIDEEEGKGRVWIC